MDEQLSNDQILLEEGITLLHYKDYDEAATVFKKLIVQYPKSRYAGMALSWAMGAYTDAGKLKYQQEYLQSLLYHKNKKVREKSRLWLSSLYSWSGNKSAAKSLVNTTSIDDPIGFEIRLSLAIDLLNLYNDKTSADEIFNEILFTDKSQEKSNIVDYIKNTYSISDGLYKPNVELLKIDEVPSKYDIINIFPNPFNPITTIEYNLPRLSSVNVNIYNVLGQKVNFFRYPSQSAGIHQVIWNGKNNLGDQAPSGLYIIHFKAESLENKTEIFQKYLKVIMIK